MTRILTATILVAAILASLYGPPWVFTIGALLVLLLGWREFADLTGTLGIGVASAPGGLLAVAVAATFALNANAVVVGLLLAVPLLALATLREHFSDPARLSAAVAAGFVGVVWLALPVGAQIGARHEPHGALWLVFLYATVAIGDSAAYYGGSTFGRRHLAPSLSPNKTVEGSVCGLFGSALAGAVVVHWLPEVGYLAGAIAGAILGLVGQSGDLLESALKRAAGRKDSSNLLPGHGGILDRIDAHLPAGAVLYAALRAGWLG